MTIIEDSLISIDIKRLSRKHDFTKKIYEKGLTLLKQDTHYPSLEFKHITCKANKYLYSFRLTKSYRALANFNQEQQTITIIRILTHAEYDKYIKDC